MRLMEFPMVKFIGIISLVIYLFFLMVLVYNLHKKNKIIKGIFALLIIAFIGILLQYNETVLDSVLSLVVRYIYYPNFATFMVLVFVSLGILLYTIFNDKMHVKTRIINYVFSSWIIIAYIIFVLLSLDVTSVLALYSGTSLICLRFVTRGFLVWVVTLVALKSYYYFMSIRR